MVYIDKSGQVVESPGVVKKFKEAISIFILFFYSLFSPITELFSPSTGSGSSNSRSSTGAFRSSSGSNNNNGNNRRGGFRTMSDIRPPPMPFGGCSGGSCG